MNSGNYVMNKQRTMQFSMDTIFETNDRKTKILIDTIYKSYFLIYTIQYIDFEHVYIDFRNIRLCIDSILFAQNIGNYLLELYRVHTIYIFLAVF